jgi:hypothetical protein
MVLFGTEQGPYKSVNPPDDQDSTNHRAARTEALWGNLMGGGAGVEWYFGSKYPHMDVNCEDFRSRDRLYDQTRHAHTFFHEHLPFWEMAPGNKLATGQHTFVFAKPGQVYAVYLQQGGTASLTLEAGEYSVHWFNPREGGTLQKGSVDTIKGPGKAPLGTPPSEPEKDWCVLVKRR